LAYSRSIHAGVHANSYAYPVKEMCVTGIKVIDLLAPYCQGGIHGIIGEAGVGKTILAEELTYSANSGGVSVFVGVGEVPDEDIDLYVRASFEYGGFFRPNDIESARLALVFGHASDTPASRARLPLTGLTVAEYFANEQGQNSLLFIDNTFRFTEADPEMAALLGRIPAALGYQPTIATDMGNMEERIRASWGGITTVQTIHVPPKYLMDEAAATAFASLDATTVLSRDLADLGIYPAIDPLKSTSRMLEPDIVGVKHCEAAHNVQKLLQDYKDLQEDIVVLGTEDGLSEDDKLTVSRARKVQRFLSQPMWIAGWTPVRVSVSETVEGVNEIMAGKHDDKAESAFFMVGNIQDVATKHERLIAEPGWEMRRRIIYSGYELDSLEPDTKIHFGRVSNETVATYLAREHLRR
jgi:F0F1-type ATP synthase beta subunit